MKKFLVTLCCGFAVAGCVSEPHGGVEPPKKFSVDDARSYFDENAEALALPELMSSKESNTRSANMPSIVLAPNWKEATSYRTQKMSVVDVPLLSNVHQSALRQDKRADGESLNYKVPDIETRLSIIGAGDEVQMLIVTMIPDLQELQKGATETRFMHPKNDFSGIVMLSDLDGRFRRAYNYSRGEAVALLDFTPYQSFLEDEVENIDEYFVLNIFTRLRAFTRKNSMHEIGDGLWGVDPLDPAVVVGHRRDPWDFDRHPERWGPDMTQPFDPGSGCGGPGGGGSGIPSQPDQSKQPEKEPKDPCENTRLKIGSPSFNNMLRDLQNLAKTGNYEAGRSYTYKDGVYSFETHDGAANSKEIDWSPDTSHPIDGFVHSHPQKTGTLPIFSPDDLFIPYAWQDRVTENFTLGLVTNEASFYLIVEDKEKYNAFAQLCTDAITYNAFKWAYGTYKFNSSMGAQNAADSFARLLKASNTGMTLMMKSHSETKFKKVGIDANNNVQYSGC